MSKKLSRTPGLRQGHQGLASPWGAMTHRSRGYALITAMIFLLILSGMAVMMLRSGSFQGRIAGNTLDKQRAQQAAEAALRYGEWMVSKSGSTSPTTCAGVLLASSLTTAPICNAALATPTTLPWTNRVDYVPNNMTVSSGGGLNTGTTGLTGDINYAAKPSFYIAWMGYSATGNSLYQVTAAGYGGNANSASVVQSIYSVSSGTRCGDCP